jgi:hypothetical protein
MCTTVIEAGSTNKRSAVRAGLLVLSFIAILSGYSRSIYAQWKLSLQDHGPFAVIYFLDLPGAPRIGFVGTKDPAPSILYKTTDGGNSWRSVQFPSLYTIIEDIVFKDTLTGWLAAGDGCYVTKDGGETWSQLSLKDDPYAIFFDSTTNGLFASTFQGFNDYVSWDEGLSWNVLQGGFNTGFAFTSDSLGILASQYAYGPSQPQPWLRTTDGGRSWNKVAMDSECWQPLAIRGTKTQFAITDHSGTVVRTDDLWETWKILYEFPLTFMSALSDQGTNSSGCIRGDMNHLFVEVSDGCYLSTDQGLSWRYLCGQPNNFSFYDQRFYARWPYVYITSCDIDNSGENIARLWMLDLDSIQYFSSRIDGQFPDGSKHIEIDAGSGVIVSFMPTIDTLVGIDSVHLSIRFDSLSLTLTSLNIPSGWSILRRIEKSGMLDLWLVDTAALQLPSPILQLTFSTVLASQSPKVYLDSAHLYGKRLNCDCQAISIGAPDSVEIDFTGCGDSALLSFMQTGKLPFAIQSVAPNPTNGKLTVTLLNSASNSVQYEIFDALGHTALEGTLNGTTSAIDLQSLASGSYFLRLSVQGQTESRRIVVER